MDPDADNESYRTPIAGRRLLREDNNNNNVTVGDTPAVTTAKPTTEQPIASKSSSPISTSAPATAPGKSYYFSFQESFFNNNGDAAEQRFPKDFSNRQLKSITWDQVDVTDNQPTGLFSIPFQKWKHLQLRTMAMRLKIPRARSARKMEVIESIIILYKNKAQYADVFSDDDDDDNDNDDDNNNDTNQTDVSKPNTKSRRSLQCPFRLMNILFSDEFAEDFGWLSDTADRDLLDRKIGQNQDFWERVAEAFVNRSDYEFGKLQHTDDIQFMNLPIDPSIVIPHDWKKLRKIWSDVNGNYKLAHLWASKYDRSGNDDPSFHRFCDRKKETYYLWLKVNDRQNRMDSAKADIPVICDLSSDKPIPNIETKSGRKRKSATKDAFTLLTEYKKIKLQLMKLEEEKLQLMELDVEMRRKKEERREEERIQRKQRNDKNDLWMQYDILCRVMKDIRDELKDDTLDADDREDLMDKKLLYRNRQKELQKILFPDNNSTLL